jgi:hypothetical protein
MQISVDTINNKVIGKFSILEDLFNVLHVSVNAFSSHKFSGTTVAKALKNKQKDTFCASIDKTISEGVINLQLAISEYEDLSSAYLVDYYVNRNRDASNKNSEKFITDLQSFGVLDKFDQIFNTIKQHYINITGFAGFKVWINKYINFQELVGESASLEIESDGLLADFANILEVDRETKVVIKTIQANIISKLKFTQLYDRLVAAYGNIKISFPIEKINTDLCICGAKLVIPDDTIEIVCSKCSVIKILVGTAHDKDKNDKYTNTTSKNKRYEPKRHCDKRLMQIQAKEDKKIPSDVIEKLIELAKIDYRYGNGVRSMQQMSCKQVRRWLKQKSFTKYNHHAPLIRKLVTAEFGEAISPPQLTPEEEQQILLDFNVAVKCYEDITQTAKYKERYENVRGRTRQRNKPNKFYYWFVLFQIISHILKDTDKRKNRLLECIHMQSNDTIDKDDDIWKMMCESGGMPKGYIAKKTDKNVAAKIF